MKKVMCLIDTLGMGGAERQMIGLALFLKKKGYPVDLITYHDSEFVQLDDMTYVTLNVDNNRWSKIKAVREYIKAVGGFDCVVAYKDGPSVICCILKVLIGGFKLIVSERNTNLQLSKNDKLKFFLYRFADYVVPNSFSQELFIKQNFPNLSRKVVTITNFTDTDFFVPAQRPTNTCFTVLTVARIAKQKNVINYLKAIKKIKDLGLRIKFEWYGSVQINEDDYGQEVFELQRKLGLEDMITFYPATTDILPHYQSCDVFCLPSIYEGFPNVVCEAMSCGKPIVCSRVCDNPDIVQDGVNGIFFDPYEVNDIVEKLISIMKMSKEDLRNYGKQSRNIAIKLFSKEAFVNKYIDLVG